jgi:hypothetical protein
MTKKLIKSVLIGSVLGIAIIGVGLYTNIIKLPLTKEIHVQYAADFNDNKVLMGAAHNVFIGKVIKQVGVKEIGSGPETQFEVDIVSNIKGGLQGSIVVNQQGGYKNGILYLVDGGDVLRSSDDHIDTLLQPGSTYLFATRYNEGENWYTIIAHPNSKKLLSNDGGLDKGRLQILAEQDEKFVALSEAYKHEIPLESDVRENNLRNSYQSAQEER